FSMRVQKEATVVGNRVKLQQVLINLLKNAAHAIQGKDDGRITLVLDAGPAGAIVTVEDNGCGMTAEVAERIWEPFFSTKGDEGNGLGLDIVKEIVEAHGGQISCQTAPGRGASFVVRLPEATQADPAGGDASHSRVAPVLAAGPAPRSALPIPAVASVPHAIIETGSTAAMETQVRS
ncbi:MAG TPA: ATP-binding protein, partial [Pirellulales bacterium]|nr:ATP-binding protein [Pirellulales bacterium]